MKSCDCENCSLSWEDRSYEGECNDCGCLVYGDLYGNKFLCRFPEFIKWKIAKRKQKKIDEKQAKQYEGIGKWFDEQQKRENAMRTAIKEVLLTDRYDGKECSICREDNGKLFKIDTDSLLIESHMRLIWRYEELLQEGSRDE